MAGLFQLLELSEPISSSQKSLSVSLSFSVYTQIDTGQKGENMNFLLVVIGEPGPIVLAYRRFHWALLPEPSNGLHHRLPPPARCARHWLPTAPACTLPLFLAFSSLSVLGAPFSSSPTVPSWFIAASTSPVPHSYPFPQQAPFIPDLLYEIITRAHRGMGSPRTAPSLS